MTGTILPLIKAYLTMQRNANMLKNLKKVRFCRFYRFLCKNAVPCLSPGFYTMRHESYNTLTLNNIHDSISRK